MPVRPVGARCRHVFAPRPTRLRGYVPLAGQHRLSAGAETTGSVGAPRGAAVLPSAPRLRAEGLQVARGGLGILSPLSADSQITEQPFSRCKVFPAQRSGRSAAARLQPARSYRRRGASSAPPSRLQPSFPAESGGETVTSGIAGAGFEGG